MSAPKLLLRPAWAYVIRDGESPELVPWGCGKYWQLPVFHSRKDAKAWAEEHPLTLGHKRKLVRVGITAIKRTK